MAIGLLNWPPVHLSSFPPFPPFLLSSRNLCEFLSVVTAPQIQTENDASRAARVRFVLALPRRVVDTTLAWDVLFLTNLRRLSHCNFFVAGLKDSAHPVLPYNMYFLRYLTNLPFRLYLAQLLEIRQLISLTVSPQLKKKCQFCRFHW